MHKGRVEAFSDGVVAIIITIMVLELRVPHGASWADLAPLWPVFFSYVLSFINVGLYWNNHHHMFQAVEHVDGSVLWANLFLLFWLSLIPFTTSWIGENEFATIPVALYGIDLLMCAIAYSILVRRLLHLHGANSKLARAIGQDRKGYISLGFYIAAIPLAFVATWLSLVLILAVALVWIIPDTRFERLLKNEG